MGDGEQDDGTIWEAAMAAGQYKLENLTAFDNHNGLCMDGYIKDINLIS